jgi:Holliday junction resolvase RusA-like endonuclease
VKPASFSEDTFQRALERDTRDIDYVRSKVVDEYNKATGFNLSLSLKSDDPAWREVVRWLNGLDHVGFVRRTPTLEWLVHSSMSAKINRIAQWHCVFCNTGFPSLVLPVRIKALSYQSTTPKVRAAFKRALKDYLKEKHDFAEKSVCLHITVAIGSSSRIADLDNIAKLFLDALKGSLFRDDRQVEHLSIVRIRTRETEDYVYVRVTPINQTKDDDVLFAKTDHIWAVGDAIDLNNYLDLTT